MADKANCTWNKARVQTEKEYLFRQISIFDSSSTHSLAEKVISCPLSPSVSPSVSVSSISNLSGDSDSDVLVLTGDVGSMSSEHAVRQRRANKSTMALIWMVEFFIADRSLEFLSATKLQKNQYICDKNMISNCEIIETNIKQILQSLQMPPNLPAIYLIGIEKNIVMSMEL